MTLICSSPARPREITSGTREWADYNVNCIKGCFNNCRYCYAKNMAKRFGRCTEDTWKDMEISEVAVQKKYGKYSGRVMFPSSHDIIDQPAVQEACFTVIQKLLEAGNETLITTKPKLSITKGIIKRFHPFNNLIQFRFTITSLNDRLLSYWEPNAPSYEERLASLKYAYKMHFKTSVSIEPFLDYNPKILIEMVAPYVTESIWVGPMNYIPKNGLTKDDELFHGEIRRNYGIEHLRDIYASLFDFPLIRFKDSMTNRLGISEHTDL
ncbi:MAG: Radical protein [Dehalococcoidia bacterium]|nr:Radical protein [Dehalococcoidia bacterium]